jgi:hypothetical protein
MKNSPRFRCPRFGVLAAAAAAMVATAAPSRAQAPAPDAAPAATPTISTGQTIDLARHRQINAPTVFVFYNATSGADRELVAALTRRAAGSTVGLRLIALPGLHAPAAKQHAITETPTVLVQDRWGKTLARTSKMDEINTAVLAGLRQARLKWVDERAPEAADVYKNLGGGREPVPGILKTMSLRPDWMNLINELSGRAHFSTDTALPRRTKEMIAAYVSGINRCKY